jgi:hypothetical protein
VLLFTLGFVLPPLWILAAVLPLPRKPVDAGELEKADAMAGSEEDVAHAMMRHGAGDAEQRWAEARLYRKAAWWRMLNRVMSVIGILVMVAVVSCSCVCVCVCVCVLSFSLSDIITD